MKIDAEFHELIPPLTTEERRQLEANIIADGCREPLVTWNGTLLDGHNRYEICQRNKIAFTTVDRDFENRDEAKAWIIRNQFGRRNLTSFQRTELGLLLIPFVEKRAKENQRLSDGPGKGRQKSDNLTAPIDSLAEVAKVAGVSRDTMHRAKVISEEAPEEAKAALRKGETTINKVYSGLRPKAAPTPSSRVRNRKPDFSKIAKNAAVPTRPHSSAPLPFHVGGLPQDARLAAEALLAIVGHKFLTLLNAEITELLNESAKPSAKSA